MKILILIIASCRGGAEEYALNIGKGAVREGHEVHVGLSFLEETESLRKDFATTGCYIHNIKIEENLKSSKTVFGRLLRLIRSILLIRKVQPDRVHLILNAPARGLGSVIACAILNVPTLVVFQLVYNQVPFSKRIQRILKWCRSRNQIWVNVSEYNRGLMMKIFDIGHNELTVIHNGINNRIAFSSEDKKFAIRRKTRKILGIDEDCKMLLTIGRLSHQKGYHCLIPAIPYILNEVKNAIFIWAGEGEWKEYLKDMVREYNVEDHVLFLGHREDIPALLCAADIFVLPTMFEGLSFALLEAMSAQLPIVTTETSSIPEILTHMENAMICKKEDSNDLKEAVIFALKNPEKMKEMAKKAQERAKAFSEEKMVRETLTVMKNIVQNEK